MAIPTRLKQMIGKSTKPVAFEIEKNQIRRFARAIGEENPIHFDEQAAKAAGFPNIVATPTFPCVLDASNNLFEKLGLDYRNTQHWEEQYEYFRPICAGDQINVTHKVANIYDKASPNGKLVFIVFETRGTDLRGGKVFKGRRVLVELKS